MPRTRPRPGGHGPWLLLLLAAVASPAAGQLPSSAAATSLAIPADFLGPRYLLHQYPQLGAVVPGHVGVLNTASSPGALQGVLRSDRAALLVLSRPYSLLAGQVSSDLFQIGGAVRAGPIRLGVTAGGTTGRNDDFRSNDYPVDRYDNVTLQERRSTEVQGIAGAGMGDGRWSFDVTFQAYREDFESHFLDIDHPDTLDFDVDARPRVQYGGAFRMALPGPFGTDLDVVGSFLDRTVRVDMARVVRDSSANISEESATQRESYGHAWNAGVAVSREVTNATITFHTLYSNRQGPTRYEPVSTYYVNNERRDDLESVSFGLSLERPFWWETTFRVGFRNQFVLAKTRYLREVNDGQLDVDEFTDEYLDQGFGWGLTRSFERLDVTGSLRTNIPAGDLFGTLDAVFRI